MDKINTYYSKQVGLKALALAVACDEWRKLMQKHDRTSQEQALLDYWRNLREDARTSLTDTTEDWVHALCEVPSKDEDINGAMEMAKAVTQ